MLTATSLQRQLLKWFDQYGRKNLPWQANKTPYRVWVAEIMLQQTQVATVIPYYLRFMTTFPTLQHLANAPLDTVLHLWTGLGYYSRAKNLHRTANMIMQEYNGHFPDHLEQLTTLPGIGTSTAGAILACAFNRKATILDGNVKRVLTRLYGIENPINDKKTQTQLWEIAKQLTPTKRIADYTQAMMDLGATVCTRRKPTCKACPLHKNCIANKNDLTLQIPYKTREKPKPIKQTGFLILQYKQEILLERRVMKGVWQGLWSFPETKVPITLSKLKKALQAEFNNIAIYTTHMLPTFRRTFSHYHLDITPIHLTITKRSNKKIAKEQQIWYSLQSETSIGLPKPVKQLLDQLL